MTKICVWCQSHYALPKRGCYLCSLCNEAHKEGCYTMNKNLRKLPKSSLRRCHSKLDFMEYLKTRDPKKGSLGIQATKIAKTMITQNFMSHYFPLMAKKKFVSPLFIWKFMTKNNLWIDTEIYKKMRMSPKLDSWRYAHAICPRVLDPWNFKDGGIEECYYSANVSVRSILNSQYPSGKIKRMTDVVSEF